MRFILVLLLACTVVAASAQAWKDAYERGLRLAKQGNWADAQKAFQEAIADRPEDTQEPSTVGAAVTTRTVWRNGTPYSPNFAVAYCSFKLAAGAETEEARKAHLAAAIEGFEKLLAGGKASVESMVLLASTYAAAGNMEQASRVQRALTEMDLSKAFRVDREMLDPGDLGVISGTAGPGSQPGRSDPLLLPSRFGLVPLLDFKFALLIGNPQNDGSDFGIQDVDLLKEALIKHAGYPAENIVVLKNADVATIRREAEALAARIPESGTVFLFFSGGGFYDESQKKDLLKGTDSQAGRVETMLGKVDLYRIFMSKGATIFAFFQVDRPMSLNGGYFGREVPTLGRIAQCHGTMPGENVHGVFFEGKQYGVYTRAMVLALEELHSNQIQVDEFCWQVFDRIRSGVGAGVGGVQVPTLPVVVGMTPSARF
ncbi:MAG: hypothetical protein C4340_03785 [Armatimonadota bacterium]